MSNSPCPEGRRRAASLASMNLRPVVEPATLTYVSVPQREPVSTAKLWSPLVAN